MAVTRTIEKYGRLDIVVNNAAVQPYTNDIMDVSNEQLEDTFRTNVFPHFYMTKAALPHLKKGSTIINTASRVAYEGDKNVRLFCFKKCHSYLHLLVCTTLPLYVNMQ
ncbi:SDR family oxidoreductase [Neobacillus sp. FSL H8-0543]|uniref:SDR family oxidoreductase n=1 Tax=Neobacillus sp. FSL H8-0543 TaxID=2954672 RepID=UPI003158EB6F